MTSALNLFPKWEWSQLLDVGNAANFKWEEGKTPMSDLLGFAVPCIVGYWLVIFPLMKLKISFKGRSWFRAMIAVHNLILCVWSLAMFVGGGLALLKLIARHGYSIMFISTDASRADEGEFQYWMYMFYVSKFYELLDTVFAIFAEKPIIFLHWYHHSIVIFMVWWWMETSFMGSAMGLLLNTFVHIWMYYYYFASALKMSVWYKRYITVLQIVQFVTAFCILVFHLYFKSAEPEKYYTETSFVFEATFAINFSFLVLFSQFYLNTYKSPAAKGAKKEE